MRISRNEWAMELAFITARRSTCLRRAVGCVLLNDRGHVIATGYNGVAAGQPHCNERDLEARDMNTEALERVTNEYPNSCPGARSRSGSNLDGCHAIHAEQNALLQCRDVQTIDTCFCTTSPCMTCVKLLLNTGCRTIVFSELYPHAEAARDLWEKSGRTWTHFGERP